jgi:hypothetical protein
MLVVYGGLGIMVIFCGVGTRLWKIVEMRVLSTQAVFSNFCGEEECDAVVWSPPSGHPKLHGGGAGWVSLGNPGGTCVAVDQSSSSSSPLIPEKARVPCTYIRPCVPTVSIGLSLAFMGGPVELLTLTILIKHVCHLSLLPVHVL